MNVLIATDSFPPMCGGSGWSTYELARGLRDRGHHILVVKVAAGRGGAEQDASYDGFRVIEFHAWAPGVPGLRNYFKNERLYPRLAARLRALIASEGIDVIHGQHVLSGPAAVMAAAEQHEPRNHTGHGTTRNNTEQNEPRNNTGQQAWKGIPSVVTVRDYWPVCYRSDTLHSPRTLPLCPGCSRAAGLQHGRPRIGLTGLGQFVARMYLDANMRMKADALAAADAVIAVSSVIARDLRERLPELARTRLETIPNPVNIQALQRKAATAARPLAEPYALYVGKLAANKGTDLLIDAVVDADLDWPLVIAGDGPDRQKVEAAARASGRDVRFLGWLDQQATAVWIAHAAMLIFPSRGPESLSRVLIEASALGVPIAAMHTGGTADIIEDEITGLLSTTREDFAEDVRRIRHGEVLRQRLSAAAANRAAEKFDAASVVGRIEALYLDLLREKRA